MLLFCRVHVWREGVGGGIRQGRRLQGGDAGVRAQGPLGRRLSLQLLGGIQQNGVRVQGRHLETLGYRQWVLNAFLLAPHFLTLFPRTNCLNCSELLHKLVRDISMLVVLKINVYFSWISEASGAILAADRKMSWQRAQPHFHISGRQDGCRGDGNLVVDIQSHDRGVYANHVWFILRSATFNDILHLQ